MSVPATHFSTLEQQAHAARLGTLVFLASEVLLFSGLFTLWATYRAQWTDAFHLASRHTDAVLGLVDTLVLLGASLAAALAVHAFRVGWRGGSAAGLAIAAALAVLFLALKGSEWADHLQQGFSPSGHLDRGVQLFWTLYYASTGLHALHATVGVGVLATLGVGVATGRLENDRAYVLENGVSYWHLVDAIWLMIWPMFYLMRGGP